MKLSRWQTRKGEPFYKAFGLMMRGLVLTAGGEVESAVHQITSALAAYRSMGATLLTATVLSYLAKAHASLGQFEDAWRCIGDAMRTLETTKERWCEADILREARRLARFEARGHTPGAYEPPPEAPHPKFPLTLDLRRPAGV
jgi:Putative amidoligase enzyme (DUF2126)